MKKIGHIKCIPFEKVGIGKWKFYRLYGGKILFCKVAEDGREEAVEEFKDEKDLEERGKNFGIHGADLSFICRII